MSDDTPKFWARARTDQGQNAVLHLATFDAPLDVVAGAGCHDDENCPCFDLTFEGSYVEAIDLLAALSVSEGTFSCSLPGVTLLDSVESEAASA